MSPRTSSRVLGILVGWAAITTVFPTLILYRAAFNPEYQWGLFGITGVGMSPGFEVIAAAVAWGWTVNILGRRRSPHFGAAAIGWNAFLLLSLVLGALRWGSQMVLRGDAYGLRVNIAFVGPLVAGTMLVLSVYWTVYNRRPSTEQWVPWTDRRILGLGLALIPVIALLFLREGADHTLRDRIAVALTITQCILISSALDTRLGEAPSDGSMAPSVLS